MEIKKLKSPIELNAQSHLQTLAKLVSINIAVQMDRIEDLNAQQKQAAKKWAGEEAKFVPVVQRSGLNMFQLDKVDKIA